MINSSSRLVSLDRLLVRYRAKLPSQNILKGRYVCQARSLHSSIGVISTPRRMDFNRMLSQDERQFLHRKCPSFYQTRNQSDIGLSFSDSQDGVPRIPLIPIKKVNTQTSEETIFFESVNFQKPETARIKYLSGLPKNGTRAQVPVDEELSQLFKGLDEKLDVSHITCADDYESLKSHIPGDAIYRRTFGDARNNARQFFNTAIGYPVHMAELEIRNSILLPTKKNHLRPKKKTIPKTQQRPKYVKAMKVSFPPELGLEDFKAIVYGEKILNCDRYLYLKLLSYLHRSLPDRKLIDYLPRQRFGNPKLAGIYLSKDEIQTHKNAKLEVIAFCLKHGKEPVFKVSRGNNKGQFVCEITWEPEKVSVESPPCSSISKAEICASLSFQAVVESNRRKAGKPKAMLNDLSSLNLATAPLFVEYMAVDSEVETSYPIEKDPTTGTYSCRVMFATSEIASVSGMANESDAEMAATLYAAHQLLKNNPLAWKQFIVSIRRTGGKIIPRMRPIVAALDASVNKKLADIKHLKQDADELYPETYAENKPLQMHSGSAYRSEKRKLTPEEKEARNIELATQLEQYKTDESMADMRSVRESLPMTEYHDQVMTMINSSEVCIVVGSTGSGKSTQVPQMILDEMIRENRGSDCNVLVTQPRRIAATSVAERVAAERGTSIGNTVGYAVRFDSHLAKEGGSINYVTTGTLLRQLENEGAEVALNGISHLIIDEVHERNVLVDFLLIVVKELLAKRRQDPTRPQVKIILMSATIDTQLFAKYFAEVEDGQCPSIEVPGRLFPVESKFLEDYLPALPSVSSYCSQTQRYINDQSHIPGSTAVTGKKLDRRDIQRQKKREIKKAMENWSLIDWKTSPNFMAEEGEEATMFKDNSYVPHDLVAALINHIVETTDTGSILAFVPGLSDIMRIEKLLRSPPFPLTIDFNDESKVRIYLLHSSQPHMQKEVFKSVPEGCRKVVISTNIAETSITIPELQHVIDCGKEREKRFVQSTRRTSLLVDWACKARLRQRRGRAGRVQNGNYYAVFSKNMYESLDVDPVPELLRSDLQELCLTIKALGFQEPMLDFLSKSIQAPSEESIISAVVRLKDLGAIHQDESLTNVGRFLSQLPLEPSIGRMVLLGVVFKCLDSVITLAALSGSREIFVIPSDRRNQAMQSRRKFCQGTKSDQLGALLAFNSWRRIYVDNPKAATQYAMDNFLHAQTCRAIYNTASQIEELMIARKIIPRPEWEVEKKHESYLLDDEVGVDEDSDDASINGGGSKRGNTYRRKSRRSMMGPVDLNTNSANADLLKAIAFAGLYPRLGASVGPRLIRTAYDEVSVVHQTSCNCPLTEGGLTTPRVYSRPLPSEAHKFGTLLAFADQAKLSLSGNQMFLRQTTEVTPLAVLLFGGDIHIPEPRPLNVAMDKWIEFAIFPYQGAPSVITARKALDDILEYLFASMGEDRLHKLVSGDIQVERPALTQIHANMLDSFVDALSADAKARSMSRMDRDSERHSTPKSKNWTQRRRT